VTEYRAEGKLIQKVTYQSLYYHLKMTGEALGIKSKDFMNLQSTPLHQKVTFESLILIDQPTKGADRGGLELL
jgi:hypothetical protein